MATLTIEISDTMLAFIDREIAARDYKDRSAFIAKLIVLEMYDRDHEPDCYIVEGKIIFANEEQRERMEQKLEEALDEIERGDVVPLKKGDCARMAHEFFEEKRSTLTTAASR
jgi:metal-responsive CopG/Arc/MetJ family transcriptional regulator